MKVIWLPVHVAKSNKKKEKKYVLIPYIKVMTVLPVHEAHILIRIYVDTHVLICMYINSHIC